MTDRPLRPTYIAVASPAEPPKKAGRFRRLPSWLRAAINSTWQTFIATIALPVVRWLGQLQAWIEGTAALPSGELLGRVIGGAGVAALAGIVTAIFRRWRPAESAYNEPDPPTA